jgi:hypothetical protein
MNTDLEAIAWIFDFALEAADGQPIDHSLPDELLGLVADWAQKNDCQIGGGYRAPRSEEIEAYELGNTPAG